MRLRLPAPLAHPPHWALLLSLLLLNVYVVLRLFEVEFHDHMGSIEGAFIAMARYFRDFGYTDWWPWWYGGFPTPMVYPPGLHGSVAALSSATGWSVAHSYHRLTALTYSMGALSFYALLFTLTRSKATAWSGGAMLSLLSPSLLLLPSLSGDPAAWLHPQRLEAMVVWGEGPNITGLALLPLAIAALHWALERNGMWPGIAVVVALASVPLVNWPSAIALAIAVVSYLLARDREDQWRSWRNTILWGAIGYALISPLLPPSAVLHTLTNAHQMGGRPVRDASYYLGWYGLLLTLFLLRWALVRWRASIAIRFTALLTFFLTAVLLLAEFAGVALLPQPLRFHLAWELAAIALLSVLAHSLLKSHPRIAMAAVASVLLVTVLQTPRYRSWARGTLKPIAIESKVEYQTARWFARATPQERVFALGSVEFWMNVFTHTPQVIGCCEQSVINPVYRAVGYVMGSDDGAQGKETEISFLWLKATGSRAAWIGGPQSREIYHDYRHPGKFDYLELAWQQGDDRIFWVPKRQPGLARVIRREHLVARTPENGIDVDPLRPYVEGLEDGTLPIMDFSQPNPDEMVARGKLEPDHLVSFQMNFHPGWKARVNGRETAVLRDGLNYFYVEPKCEGNCEVRVEFSGGGEAWATRAMALAGALLLAGMALPRRKRDAAA
ncbi:MAG: hypothetical protein U5J83_05215 [Bryobacterales bacterium]|nr:hypothetical protein [Bryobacterales bacterium]